MDDAPSHPGPSHPVMAPPSNGLSSATQSDSAVVRPPFWDSGPWAGRSRCPQRPSLRLGDVSTSTSNPTACPAATKSAEGLPATCSPVTPGLPLLPRSSPCGPWGETPLKGGLFFLGSWSPSLPVSDQTKDREPPDWRGDANLLLPAPEAGTFPYTLTCLFSLSTHHCASDTWLSPNILELHKHI